MKSNNVIFIDLDGTLRKPKKVGNIFIDSPEDQELIDGAENAIAYYSGLGYCIVGISNQGGVSSGFLTIERAIEIQKYTLKLIPQLEAIYFCPDMVGDLCVKCDHTENVVHYDNASGAVNYRKPGTGMLNLALSELQIDWGFSCLMIGDRDEDFQCAANAKIPFVWADYWRQQHIINNEIGV